MVRFKLVIYYILIYHVFTFHPEIKNNGFENTNELEHGF